jgi:hypothetical protein
VCCAHPGSPGNVPPPANAAILRTANSLLDIRLSIAMLRAIFIWWEE